MRNAGPIQIDNLTHWSPDEHIDAICDQFEQDWHSGARPDLRVYAQHGDVPDRSRLVIELLLVDWEMRSGEGEILGWDEYRSKYPEFTEEIEAARVTRGGEFSVTFAVDHQANGMIAQFALLAKLGAGASGTVWKAKDLRLQRTVAIKIPHSQFFRPEDLSRFLREAKAVAQLTHPRIVPVFDVGRDGESAYIVSALVPGQNLRQWLDRVRPTWREAAEMCGQLADALHHAHEQGVIHRDLKPSNVLVDQQGQPHITDFGLAKWSKDHNELTLEGEVLGTPAYMSPEQARGHAARADRRTDVYALGVILFELLTGRRPFEGDDPAIVTRQILQEDPTPPRKCNPAIARDLETVCLKAMSKAPQDRYLSAQEMAVDLRRCLLGEPILARRPWLIARGLRWARRRPAIAASIALAVIAVVSMGVAAKTAHDNRSLLGLRTVRLSTQPKGAHVVFVPMDEASGQPLADGRVHVPGRTPVRAELEPGEYLVVTVLDDGRFHEVYRHVPAGSNELPGLFSHTRWEIDDDEIVVLPTIRIPSLDVANGMAFIPMQPPATPQSRAEKPNGFYVDCLEFTVAEYTHSTQGDRPTDLRWKPVPSSHAATVSFDEAVARAESIGKRLPTETEFELAAAHCTSSAAFLDGDSTQDLCVFGPVGMPAEDRTSTIPPILGLCSNVAEWTSTSATQSLLPSGEARNFSGVHWRDYRIARGGDQLVIAGNATLSPTHRSPSARVAVPRYSVQPGLGFRCVRSLAPRFIAEP